MLELNLKSLMQERHLSIQDVYKGTGISRNTISQLYNGKSKGIQFVTLSKLVDYLGVEPEELFVETAEYERLEPSLDFQVDIKEVTLPNDIVKVVNDNEPLAYIGFSSPANITEEYRLLDFKLPVYVSFDKKNSCLAFDTIDEYAMDDFQESQLYYNAVSKMDAFCENNSSGKIENIFAEVITTLFNSFHFKQRPFFIGYSSDIGNRPSSYLNYLWPSEILLNDKTYSKYINAKYPGLKNESKKMFKIN